MSPRQALIEAFPGVAAILGLDGTVLEANGRSRLQAGSNLDDLAPWRGSPELRARARDAAARAARGEFVRFEAVVESGQGAVEWVLMFGPIADPGDAAPQVATFGFERGHTAAPDLYRAIFDYADDGIFVADPTGRYIDINARGCEMVGYSRAELTCMTLADLSPPEAPPNLAAMPPRMRGERLLRHKNGSLLPVELTGVKFPDGTVLGLARDISQRWRAEQALQQREAELEALSDATKEALFVHQDGRIVATNKAARELYRIPPDGAVGQALFDFIAPESADLVRQKIATGSAEPYDAFALRADGTKFPASVQARTTTFRGKPVRLAAIQDLTELRKLQASLAFADRMASIGALAAGVAHEINNPLTFITVGLEEAIRRLEATSLAVDVKAQIVEVLRDAQDGGGRVAAIVRDLRAFSRADDETTGAVELAAVIRYAARMAAAELKHRAKLVVNLGLLPLVVGNETRLGQVFLNLLINAAQAIPMGAVDQHTVTVSAHVDEDRVVVSVADTGLGMDADLVSRVFEPFITTKSHGTGLGLAICHGIVTRLGGTIEVDSASGQGTTFRVTLPVARATASADPAPPVPQQLPPQARQGRVLVIDDEPLLLRAAERILAADRHVILASSAKEALALFERDEPFDVVLCDLMMPEMTGIALFERVAVRWPNLAERFVFLTGGVFSREAAAFLERCGRPCIDKPFQINTLVAIVNAVADAAPEPVPRP